MRKQTNQWLWSLSKEELDRESLGRKATELDQSCLLGMQFQAKLGKPVLEFFEVFNSDAELCTIPHQDGRSETQELVEIDVI